MQRLRNARGFPTGDGDPLQDGVEVIDRECNVDRSNIARSQIDMLFSLRRSVVLKQFDLMSGRFEDGDRDFSAAHSGNFARKISGLMGAMRKLETENILPESQRPLEI